MHWLTLISSNIIRSSVLHRQLPALTLANAFWPTLLLMNSVADLPGSVLPTRQVTAGPDITWSDRAKEIGCVQMPVAILGSPLLSPQEKRGCLREHYLIEPECLDGLLALRPGFFLRLAWFDPGLCNVAFLKRLPRKVLARFRRRPTPGQS